MKHKSKEFDVDFIVGEDPMTKEEEKAISEFIKDQKLHRAGNRFMVIRHPGGARV